MSSVHLANIQMLYLLWALPLVLGVYLFAAHRRRQALERFAAAGLLKHISLSTSTVRRRWKAALVMMAFALIVVALVRPDI